MRTYYNTPEWLRDGARLDVRALPDGRALMVSVTPPSSDAGETITRTASAHGSGEAVVRYERLDRPNSAIEVLFDRDRNVLAVRSHALNLIESQSGSNYEPNLSEHTSLATMSADDSSALRSMITTYRQNLNSALKSAGLSTHFELSKLPPTQTMTFEEEWGGLSRFLGDLELS
jgi:hypothetical protein